MCLSELQHNLSLCISPSLSFHPSSQGVVSVGHQLPGCETQQLGSMGDQTGNGAKWKQFLGGPVPKEGLLHSRRVGLKDYIFFCLLLGSGLVLWQQMCDQFGMRINEAKGF